MGTSASVTLDIEAFRPPPPGLAVQSSGSAAAAAAAEVPATVSAGPALVTGAKESSTTSASASSSATELATSAGPAVADGGGGGEGEGNSDHRQGGAGGQVGFEAGREGALMLGAGAAARTTPAITGTRPHATRAVDEDRSIQSSTGEEDEPPTKLKALPLEVEGRGGTAVTSGLPESRTVETSDIDVGDSSSPAPGTSGARPAAAAAGVSTPDLATSNGAPPTAAAENVALAALASIVANPVAMSVGPPQHDGTTGTLAIASPRPTAASDGGSPQPQFFGVSPIDVGTESGGSGLDASPPPPRLTVQPPVPEPPCTVSDGRFHQATSLTQHAYAVCPQQPAAAAFDAAVDPQAAPARGGVAGHLGTDGKSLSAAAAATAARPSDAALGHHPPLASLLPAGTASGGGGGGGGGGPPRPKRKRSGPAAGRRPERRKCGMEGCKRRPTFGVEGTRQAEFCLSHKHDGFVNVLAKRCDAVEGCRRQPSFGMPGAKPVRCAAHRLDGMVNLSAPRCVSPGCRVVPSFAPPGARRASTCSAHRRSGDVDIVTRRCHHEGCIHRPVFGDISAGKALYCSAHKLGGMMNVFAARCTAPGCIELATFGIPGVKRPTRCSGHRDQQQHSRISSYHS